MLRDIFPQGAVMNTWLPVTIATVGLAGTLAAGQTKYPPPFPREGTVKLLENDRVVIWDNTWKKDVLYPLHEHTRDMTGVFLQWGPIRLGRPDGTFGAVNNTAFEVPSTFETQKGVIHSEQNVGDPERRGIMVELKDPNPAPLTPPPGATLSFPRPAAKQAHDGPRSTIWDYTYQPGVPVAAHFHDKDTIIVFIGGGTLRITPQTGTAETKAWKHGEVRYITRGQADSEEAVGAPVRAMIIELK
jgi:hypothetical protein